MAPWHAVQAMEAGEIVMYVHFEEDRFRATRDRLYQLRVSKDMIPERFIWLESFPTWSEGEMAWELDHWAERKGKMASLLILDGINAACSAHGWEVGLTDGVGAYRTHLVQPAAVRDVAVLSLGHPVKDRNRQEERHSYGSTAWLDMPDGVGFRLETDKHTPIRKGHLGFSRVFVVKDREGSVAQRGELQTGREAGWFLMGKFEIDDSREPVDNSPKTRSRLYAEDPFTGDRPRDQIYLCDSIIKTLQARGGRFDSQNTLKTWLDSAGISYTDKHVPAALDRLQVDGRIGRPPKPTARTAPWPGWLRDRKSQNDLTCSACS